MSIRNLDINKITRQYLDYIERMQEINFDVAGDYLYMAAVLLFLKSRSFVTEEEVQNILGDEAESELHISSEVELVKRLQELRHYQALGHKLWELPKWGHEIFTRPRIDRRAVRNELVFFMDSQQLINVWMDFLRKHKQRHQIVKKDQLSIRDKLVFLKRFLKFGEQTDLLTVLEKEENALGKEKRAHVIMTFISLLELARLKKIKIFQNERYGNIFIEVQESLENFNVNLADGFEPEVVSVS